MHNQNDLISFDFLATLLNFPYIGCGISQQQTRSNQSSQFRRIYLSEAIRGLDPKPLWQHFAQIATIPRPSKKEERIAAHIIELAKASSLEVEQDATGNIVVRKPASHGKESSPMVALQSHVDMVCEKNRDSLHDFERDGIQLIRLDGHVKANGTTLGSDNGIGVAAALSVMLDPTIVHGPLEFLFTVDEETGLTGANGLRSEFLRSRILLNLDSEDEGTLYIGCAGGRDTILRHAVERELLPQGYVPLGLAVTGLRGGHSGGDIHTRRANAIKLLARALWLIARSTDIRLASIEGGDKLNAIPREAEAVVYIKGERLKAFRDRVDELNALFKDEYATVEQNLRLRVSPNRPQSDGRVFTKLSQDSLIKLLYVLPHGVIAMSADIPGLVETSTNVAALIAEPSTVVIGTSQRSSVPSSLADIVNVVSIHGQMTGCTVEPGVGYPGWKPNLKSHALQVAQRTYKELFEHEPMVKAVHAGLECGIFEEKFAGMDMVSFGPTIEAAHSPDERVEIESVRKFWDLLLALLTNLSM
jgi:dipeptidase D